ncbi:MAG: porin family protein [Porphyromonadaceae bacterium]|nr:porin family protein [Porphyromonadaceae bacterium]
MSDPWQDNLRNRMERHEEPAPEGLWEGIERLITGNSTVEEIPSKPRHWVRGIYIGAVSAVAVITVLLLLVLRYTSSENQADVPFTEKTTPVVPVEEHPIAKIPMAEIPVTERSSQRLTSQKIKNRPALRLTQLFQEPDILTSANQNPDSSTIEMAKNIVEEKETAARDSDPENRENVSTPDSERPASDRNAGNDRLLAMNTGKDRQNHSKWQTGLSLSNAPSGSSTTYSGYGTLAVAETVDKQYDFVPNYKKEQAYTDVKHHQPVTFGLTLRYNFTERWSVSSGLTYSLLSSELYSGNGNYYYDDRQTLHYIGIPVNIAYTFWQNNKISAYLSTGGLVEKNVVGRLTSNYYIDNHLEITTKEKIRSKELQWSVNGAMGLGYRISNNIGLYAEPGISYYFRNGSELETIYKDNPLNFNLQLGLRFTFND